MPIKEESGSIRRNTRRLLQEWEGALQLSSGRLLKLIDWINKNFMETELMLQPLIKD